MSGPSAVAADGRLAAYDFGPGQPFQAGRLEAGLSLLRAAGVLGDGDVLAFEPAADADLELVHDRDYLEAIARFSGEPAIAAGTREQVEAARFGLVGDNRPFPGMDEAARLVAGATVAAADAVAAGAVDHAFVPVGGLHHAQRRRASGFCLLNDVAVAVARCTRARPWRVLYVDLDAHHGDGVQAAFYDDPRVCTVSLHETGRYLFPGSGEVHELGRPPGVGRSVNLPLEPRTGDDGFLAAFDAVVEPLAAAFRPDLLMTQNGCDGHERDPLSDLALSTRGFRELAGRLHRLAHRHCQGRWVATGGGGYDLKRVLPRAWALLWSQMSGRRLPSRLPAAWLAADPARAAGPGAASWLDPRPRRASARAGAPRTGPAGATPNARTIRTVRRLVLPLPVRAAYPGSPGVPSGGLGLSPPDPPVPADGSRRGAHRLPEWEPRAAAHDAPRGQLVLRDRCPASLVRRLDVDPGIHTFARDPDRQREVLARIAEEPGGDLVVAHTPAGMVVGYVAIIDPEPGSRFARVPGVFEVGAVEVAGGWRRGGVGSALLRFAVAAEPFRDLVLVASGLAWHWDLEGSGLTALAYRRAMLRVLRAAGFEELATDEPEVAYDPANLFVARVGDRVPPERRAAFTGRLVRGGSRSSSR